MLAERNAVYNAVPGSEHEPMHAVFWWNNSFLGFESVSTFGCDTYMYGDTVVDVVPAVVGSSVSGLVEDYNDWSLGYISLSRKANVRESLCVCFTVI